MTEPLQSPPASPTIAEPTKKRKWLNLKGWWWRFPVAFIALYFLFDGIINTANGKNGRLPTCDSEYGQQLVKDAVKNGPMSKILNLELIAIKDIAQRSATDDKVVCQAKGFTNAGEQDIVFGFEWVNKARGEFITTVTDASMW